MKYYFFVIVVIVVIGSCTTATSRTNSLISDTPDYAPVAKPVVTSEHTQVLEQRIKELEKLLDTKEEEITTLRQIYQSKQKTKESQRQEKIIIQSLNRELEKDFRLKNQELPFEIGKNKKAENLQIKSSSNSSVKSDFLEKNIALISVQEIKPSLFYSSPANPIRSKPISVAKKKYKSIYQLYSQRKYDQAIREFSKFIAFYPNANEADNAVFWIAMSYLKKNKEDKAQQYLAYLLQNYSFLSTDQGGKTSDALLALGKIQEKKNPSYSKDYYRLVIKYYPNSQSAKKAQNLLRHL